MRTERNPPILIEGEDVVVGYDHIVSYMSSNHKVVNMNDQLAGELVADGGSRAEGAGGGAGGGDKIDVTVRLGGSSYSMVQIGVSFLYRQCGIERPAHVRAGVSLYC